MKVFSFISLSEIPLELQDPALENHGKSNKNDFSQVLAQDYVVCPL